MKIKRLLCLVVILASFSLSLLQSGNIFAATDKIVATVKGEPLKASELAAHIAATKLPRDEALNDLIEQKLLRIAAAAKGVNVPAGRWSEEERAKVDTAMVKALSLPIPAHVGELVVDHAYLKLPQDDKGQQAGLALMEKLRAMVEGGATIQDAFNRLQVDGSNWHIGDHEEYPASVLPDETRDLPPGGLSKVLVSSDGYNLFKIHDRKIPLDDIRLAVRIYLLDMSSELVNIVEE